MKVSKRVGPAAQPGLELGLEFAQKSDFETVEELVITSSHDEQTPVHYSTDLVVLLLGTEEPHVGYLEVLCGGSRLQRPL